MQAPVTQDDFYALKFRHISPHILSCISSLPLCPDCHTEDPQTHGLGRNNLKLQETWYFLPDSEVALLLLEENFVS